MKKKKKKLPGMGGDTPLPPPPTPSPFNSFHKGCKSSIHPQVCTRSLILNLKILKLLYLFSGFLDRLCFLLKFRIDKYFKKSPKVCTRSLILNPKHAKTPWCGRGTPTLSPSSSTYFPDSLTDCVFFLNFG